MTKFEMSGALMAARGTWDIVRHTMTRGIKQDRSHDFRAKFSKVCMQNSHFSYLWTTRCCCAKTLHVTSGRAFEELQVSC